MREVGPEVVWQWMDQASDGSGDEAVMYSTSNRAKLVSRGEASVVDSCLEAAETTLGNKRFVHRITGAYGRPEFEVEYTVTDVRVVDLSQDGVRDARKESA